MALTYFPEDTGDLELKTQRDIRCESCGQRRTIDGYDQPTVASCIAEDCRTFYVIPAYPFTNSEIEHVDSEMEAKNRLEELQE